MSAADTAAVKAIAESAGASAYVGHVFVTKAPDVLPTWAGASPATGLPYVLLHPADGTDEATRLTGPPTTEHPEYTFHVVGASASSVQVVVGLLKAKFKPTVFVVAPTVAGRLNQAAYWRSPQPIQTDKDVTPWLVYQVIEYGWTSNPA